MSTVTPIFAERDRFPFLQIERESVTPSRKPERELMQWPGWTVTASGTTISIAALEGQISQPAPSKKGADVTSEMEADLSYLTALGILVSDPANLRRYLLHHHDIMDVIVSVCETARERFGTPTQLALEIYRDPEIEDEYPTIYVRHRDYGQNLVGKIKEIRRGYEQMLVGKTGWFLLTTDFRPPKY